MKTKITLLLGFLFVGMIVVSAQDNEEDLNSLSIFDQYAKAKNYEAAYGPWKELRDRNPKFSRAIYTHGEKILKYKIDNSSGAEKVAFVNDLMSMYDQRIEHFASKTKIGDILSKKAQLMYDNKSELGSSDLDIYNAFSLKLKNLMNQYYNFQSYDRKFQKFLLESQSKVLLFIMFLFIIPYLC